MLDYFYFVLMIRKAQMTQNDKALRVSKGFETRMGRLGRGRGFGLGVQGLSSVARRIDTNDIKFWPVPTRIITMSC